MPAQRVRLRPAVRGVLAVAAAALLASLLPAPGGAEERGITLAVHLGYHDLVRQGQWMPVTVEAQNHGPDFQGTLEIELQSFQGGFGKGPAVIGVVPQSSTTSQLALSLPAGGVKHLRAYVLADNPAAPVVARLSQNGRTVASQSALPVSTASTLIGVLSDQPAALDEFGAIRLSFSAPSPQTVHLQLEDLPESAILLRAFDLLAIDDFATSGLTAAQRSALADYVADGGNLLLGTGASWRKTLSGLPPTLQPVQPDRTVTVTDTSALSGAGPVEVATGGSLSGRTWLAAGQRPLLVEKDVGGGLVTVALFDWAQDPIASWGGARGLLRQVAIRSLLRGAQGPPVGFGGGGVLGPFVIFSGAGAAPYGAPGSVSQRSSVLIGPLGNLPALDLPPLKLTGLLILLYVLVIGPLNYVVLRAVGRRELAWVTVPVVAIVFAAGAYGIGVGTKGRAVQSNQVSIVHLIGGWNTAYRETYTGIFTPTRGDFTVAIQGKPLVAPILTSYGPQGPLGGGIRVRPVEGSVDLLGVTAYSLRGFASESLVPAPPLSANVRLTGGRLIGRVENHSSIGLSDAVIVAGDNFQILGALAPGTGAEINLDPASSGLGNAPLFFRIYPNSQYGPQSGPPSAAQREGNQRAQILQLVLGGFKGPATPVAPTLIAWTKEPLEAITVNGHIPRAHAENAIVLPLTIDQLASGPIPSGLLASRLIDATGELNSVNPGGIYVRDGSAIFEFYAPIAAGLQLVEAGIRNSNPYGAKFAPGPLGPTGPAAFAFKSEVWDWSRSAWTSIPLKDNDTAPIPAAAIDPATGTVRLRLRSVAGSSFQAGYLSLAGTLR